MRQVMISAASLDALDEAVDQCERYHVENDHKVRNEGLSWYRRHREDHVLGDKDAQPTETVPKRAKTTEETSECKDDNEEQDFCGLFGTDQADY